MDERALEIRSSSIGDLDHAILGDLKKTEFAESQFDVVYCCDVLEHVSGAEGVVNKFFRWLKPDGVIVLIFPDRDTVRGFITRISPHWLHLACYKYIVRKQNAGKSGYGPYPTYFDKIISRRAMYKLCQNQGYNIFLEYGRPDTFDNLPHWFTLVYKVAR